MRCPGHTILGDSLRLVQVRGQHLRVSVTLNVSSCVPVVCHTPASGALLPTVVLPDRGPSSSDEMRDPCSPRDPASPPITASPLEEQVSLLRGAAHINKGVPGRDGTGEMSQLEGQRGLLPWGPPRTGFATQPPSPQPVSPDRASASWAGFPLPCQNF